MPLDRQDLDVLIEALESWVNKDEVGAIIGTVLDSMLGDKASPEVKNKMEEQRQKQATDKQLRKERAIMLQAKLLSIRDSLLADQVIYK